MSYDIGFDKHLQNILFIFVDVVIKLQLHFVGRLGQQHVPDGLGDQISQVPVNDVEIVLHSLFNFLNKALRHVFLLLDKFLLGQDAFVLKQVVHVVGVEIAQFRFQQVYNLLVGLVSMVRDDVDGEFLNRGLQFREPAEYFVGNFVDIVFQKSIGVFDEIG